MQTGSGGEGDMALRHVQGESEVRRAFPVMHELRTHYSEDEFVACVLEQMENGYRLALLERRGEPVAAAGYRFGRSLAWGRYLYVDDLVTKRGERSHGHGHALLHWLSDHARETGCDELHLDSGVERKDAHRFYEREGLGVSGKHFKVPL